MTTGTRTPLLHLHGRLPGTEGSRHVHAQGVISADTLSARRQNPSFAQRR